MVDTLKDAQSNIRIEAAEALKEIGVPEGIKRLTDYCNNTLKFGDLEHKIEAITIIRGRGYSTFLSPEFKYKEERARQLENLQRKLPLELVQSALLSIAIDENEAAFIRWYASIALTELGYINDEILKVLIETSIL